MPMPIPHIKERLSVSYVMAVAAKAGVACRLTSQPEYGVDGYFVKLKQNKRGKYDETGFIVNFQVKATCDYKYLDDHVIYDLDIDAYNKLAEWEGDTECILILFCMPEDSGEWLNFSEEELVLKRCCYWKLIKGETSTNKSSTRITIPTLNVLTPDVIPQLFDLVKYGG